MEHTCDSGRILRLRTYAAYSILQFRDKCGALRGILLEQALQRRILHGLRRSIKSLLCVFADRYDAVHC